MSDRAQDSRAAFWMAVVFTGLMTVGWNWKTQTERAAAALLQQDVLDARAHVARLEVVHADHFAWQRETDNLKAQLAQLAAIMPPSAGIAERELTRRFADKGLHVSGVERLRRSPTSHPPHHYQDLRLKLEPAGRSWLEPLDGSDNWRPFFRVRRLVVIDPRDPEASAVLDVALLLSK